MNFLKLCCYGGCFVKVAPVLAVVGLSSAELMCEDYEMIAQVSSAALSSEDGIALELDIISKHVCHAVPAEMNCEENLPDFWAAIAVNLFNPDNGFFASNNLCMESCGNMTEARNVLCHDCENVMNMELDKMADPEIQIMVVEAFVGSEFCAEFGEDMLEQCQTGLELVLPVAMEHLAGQLHRYLHDFCVDDIQCDNHTTHSPIELL